MNANDVVLPLIFLTLGALSYWYSKYLYHKWQWADGFILTGLAVVCIVTSIGLLLTQESLLSRVGGVGLGFAVAIVRHEFLLRRQGNRVFLGPHFLRNILRLAGKVVSASAQFYRRERSEIAVMTLFLGGAFYLDITIALFVGKVDILAWPLLMAFVAGGFTLYKRRVFH